MSEPFLGEVRMFGFNFAPKNWASCDGQEILMKDNPALYSLLGSAYGGDDHTYFNLPDLRGRTPIHIDSQSSYAYMRGHPGGSETVTLTIAELPGHQHSFYAASEEADKGGLAPDKRVLAKANGYIYGAPSELVALTPFSCSETGGGLPHTNEQPSLVINFCIALSGAYPTRN